ncbi:hypothetical protein MMC26_001617 [Xylographa opegraphella]|nr:hypothetical protein [Xylographa opegraphella]
MTIRVSSSRGEAINRTAAQSDTDERLSAHETENEQTTRNLSSIVNRFRPDLSHFEQVYKDLHQYPELSGQEARTASIAESHLRRLNFTTHGNIGGGVVGVLENGPGLTILLRADMDALPIAEKTGLTYASHHHMKGADGIERPVMHACGHDTHITSLMAAASLLISARKEWKGTLVCLFQPNEEHGGGAQAMVDDGLYDKIPRPDVLLAQHVCPLRSGVVAIRSGPILSAASTLKVRIWGQGGHGSEPQNCIDPIVIAGYILVRLQSVVSRVMDPKEIAVVTCGSIHGGDAGNVIPDFVDMMINIRTYSQDSHSKALEAVEGIVKAECEASKVSRKPSIEVTDRFPLTSNDAGLVEALTKTFKGHFEDNFWEMSRSTASEDFSVLATAVAAPYAFWTFGGTEPTRWDDAYKKNKLSDLPSNHSSLFAPIIEPTLKTGIDACALAALTFLAI